MAESFEAGAEIVRALAQGPGLPDVIRVSDEEETQGLAGALGPARRCRQRSSAATSACAGARGGCLMIVGLEGERGVGRAPPGAGGARAARRRRRLPRPGGRALLGARPLPGPLPARHADGDGGDGRDAGDLAHLVPAGRAARGGRRRRSAARSTARARPGLVFCHLSHAYADGASLYFTFISRARHGEEIEQWRAVKRAACEAIVAAGGTITHHHAVGRDHAPYMEAEVGRTGLDVLRAVKERLDPAGIMNPGKLLPERLSAICRRFAGRSIGPVIGAAEDVGRRCRPARVLLLSSLSRAPPVRRAFVGQRDVDLVEGAAGEVGRAVRSGPGTGPPISPDSVDPVDGPAAAASAATCRARPCRTALGAGGSRPSASTWRTSVFLTRPKMRPALGVAAVDRARAPPGSASGRTSPRRSAFLRCRRCPPRGVGRVAASRPPPPRTQDQDEAPTDDQRRRRRSRARAPSPLGSSKLGREARRARALAACGCGFSRGGAAAGAEARRGSRLRRRASGRLGLRRRSGRTCSSAGFASAGGGIDAAPGSLRLRARRAASIALACTSSTLIPIRAAMSS